MPGSRVWRTHTIAMMIGTIAYTRSQPQVTIATMTPGSPKWNFSRLFSVAISVSTVNAKTAGTAMRA